MRHDAGAETYRVVGPKGEPALAHVLFLRVRDRALARWKHEITGVNRVGHPAIPKTLAGGASDTGRAVIVTDWVSGESLEELRRAWDGHLPGKTAIPYVCEVLEALEAAHSRGVVHGALRPRSIFVDEERVGTHVCIADFGYSRLFEESHRRGRTVSETGLSSAAFLAPEQRGAGYVADARTDIFSVAAVALYLLGLDPIPLSATEFHADVRRTTVLAKVRDAKLPDSIGDALLRALDPSRPERQAAARVLLDELRVGLSEVSGGSRPVEAWIHDDPPTIATLAELQRVLIEEARLSMGATDTGVDPLAVPRVEKPFPGEARATTASDLAREESGADAPSPSHGPPVQPTIPSTPSFDVHLMVPPPGELLLAAPPSISAAVMTSTLALDDGPREKMPSLLGSDMVAPLEAAYTANERDTARVPAGVVPNKDSSPPLRLEKAVAVGSGKSERPAATSGDSHDREHVGDLLAGRYVLDRALASGGMATVYLGCVVGDGGPARTVAIKRVHPSLAVDTRCTAMMLDEARMASRISHPNVVPILDVIREEDEIMLVLEYVHGVTASQLAWEGASQTAIPPAIATAILVGALRGLEAAHTATDTSGKPMGLVHRDVSPQNIMIGLDGAARVIDFGIARALGRAEVTTGTELRGKVAYMAPERLRGQKTDLRVDLWSAGVVLWELVSGRKLFQADDPIEVAVKVCTGAIPQTGHDALDTVLERALARDLEERFRTAAEMADALAGALPPATNQDVAAYMKKGCGLLLDAQTMALTSLKNRVEKGKLPEPFQKRSRGRIETVVSALGDDLDESRETEEASVTQKRSAGPEAATKPQATASFSESEKSLVESRLSKDPVEPSPVEGSPESASGVRAVGPIAHAQPKGGAIRSFLAVAAVILVVAVLLALFLFFMSGGP